MRWSWMYAARAGRDLRIDFLRGYALFMMIVDHVGPEWLPGNQGGQSWLYNLTGATMFYTSAAEIFYFVSGLTLGIVCATGAFEQAVRRTLGRTWTLYYTVILMSLGFSALYHVFGPKINLWSIYDLAKQDFAAFALQSLTLQVTGHGAEVLVLYVIFMMFAPLALWMLFMRRWYLVLIASGLIYAIAQIYPNYQQSNFTVTTYFPSFTWQPLFFLGLVIGFHRLDLARAWDRAPQLRNVLEITALAAALAFLWVFVGRFALWPELPALLGGFDDKGRAVHESMTPMRLGLGLLYVQAAYILISWLWWPLHRALGWLLEVLGRQSLWAFVTHMAVYVALHNLAAFNNYAGNSWWWQLLGVLAVWAFIRLYEPVARRVFNRGPKQPLPSPRPSPDEPREPPSPLGDWHVRASHTTSRIEPADALIFQGLAHGSNAAFASPHGVSSGLLAQTDAPTLMALQGVPIVDDNVGRRPTRGSRWQPRGELIGAGPISRALEAEPIQHPISEPLRAEAIPAPSGSDQPSLEHSQPPLEPSHAGDANLSNSVSNESDHSDPDEPRLEAQAERTGVDAQNDLPDVASEDSPEPSNETDLEAQDASSLEAEPDGTLEDAVSSRAETEGSSLNQADAVANLEPEGIPESAEVEFPHVPVTVSSTPASGKSGPSPKQAKGSGKKQGTGSSKKKGKKRR